MIVGIDHIGVAVRSVDEALKIFREALGLELEGIEVVEGQRVRVAMLTVGETRIELLEPTSEKSPVAGFLEKRGEGMHHIALKVTGIEKLLERLKESGIRLVDERPKEGIKGTRIAFLHPKSTSNVLIELCER